MITIERNWWTVAITLVLLVAGFTVSFYVFKTTTGIREALAEEVLEQQHDVSELMLDYSDLMMVIVQQSATPTDLENDQISRSIELVSSQLHRMRSTYSFARLDGAARAHAYTKPIIEDVSQWNSDGIGGLSPSSPTVRKLISKRLMERFTSLRVIATETDSIASSLVAEQTKVLDRFRNSLILLLSSFVALTLGIAALLTKQRNLQEKYATEQRISAQRFKDFADTGADCFWEIDIDFNPKIVTDQAFVLDRNGGDHGSIGSSTLTKSHWPLDLIQKQLEFSNYESHWKTSSGAIQVMSLSGKPLLDGKGKYKGYRGTGRDVTERKQMEELIESTNQALIESEARRRAQAEIALHSSEERFRNFAEVAADWFWELGPDLRFTYVAGRFENVMGITAANIIGMTRYELYAKTPNELKTWSEHFLDLDAKRAFVDFEVNWTRPDGELRQIKLSGNPRFDTDGNFLGYRGVGQDISRRYHAEVALRKSERFLRATLDALTTNIAILDKAGTIFTANSTWCNLLNAIDPTLSNGGIDTTYQALAQLIEDRDIIGLEVATAHIKNVVSGICDNHQQEYLIQVKGAERWISIGISTFFITNVRYAVLVFEDVTFRKRLEERDRRMHSEIAHMSRMTIVGEMASGLAHELNQPLTAISHNCDAVNLWVHEQPNIDAEIKDIVNDIYTQAQRAGEIVRSMRRLARKESAEMTTTDINRLVQDTVRLTGAEARARGVTVSLDLAADVATTLMDPIQIQQVIVNLERNAVEAIGQNKAGSRKLVISTEMVGNDNIQVSVKDSGAGFTADMVHQPFAAFRTNKHHGMGLGLSISRSIVEAHGGKIWLDTEVTDMTTLRFALPVVTG